MLIATFTLAIAGCQKEQNVSLKNSASEANAVTRHNDLRSHSGQFESARGKQVFLADFRQGLTNLPG
jgi:hypothetical protein